VFDSFIGKLQAAHESAASQELDDDIEGAEREKVKKSMAKKKMSAVLKAVRVVSSTQSASIEWASDYVRSEQEEQYWMETSDIHTHSQRREVMSSADIRLSFCIPVCLQYAGACWRAATHRSNHGCLRCAGHRQASAYSCGSTRRRGEGRHCQRR
jgi:hypothetical protein